MNIVSTKIRQIRTQNGISQKSMAEELGMSQPNYARLETKDSRINVERLIHIAKVLEVSASELLGEKSQNVIHNNNGDNAQAYIKTINSDKNHIKSLKEEIMFLREVLKKRVEL